MIRKLDWDSDFFGLSIGNTEISALDPTDAAKQVKQYIKDSQDSFDLLFVSSITKLDLGLLSELDILDVGARVVFAKELIPDDPALVKQVRDTRIDNLQSEICPIELLRLAEISGAWSRFKLDSKLPAGSFHRLYHTWIERSVSREIADEVYVYRDDTEIVAMATMSWRQDNIGVIGLIAVKANQRSLGIGTKLMQHIERESKDNGVKAIHVTTQDKNHGACAFYQHNGFKEIKRSNIYHLWINQANATTSAVINQESR